ncbi:hypothetical protein EMCRGX_G022157 [Ephydatia muelleri]
MPSRTEIVQLADTWPVKAFGPLNREICHYVVQLADDEYAEIGYTKSGFSFALNNLLPEWGIINVFFTIRKQRNDKETFQKWWHQIFLKEVREWTTSPVALLMDGFSGHNPTNGNGDEDHNSMDKLEEETLLQMNSLLPQLSTTHPSTVLMLNSIGLDVVTSKAVQGLHSDVSRMLTAWLHLEERGAVDDSAPDPDDEIGSSPEVHEQAFEKMSVLQRSIVNADLIQSSSNSAQVW